MSLEQDTHFYCNELIQEALREINLDLRSMDDDCEHYLNEINQHRW